MKTGKYSHLYTTSRWRRLRAEQLREEPLCRMCAAVGRVTAATIVDHIAPHRGDMVLFWSGPFQSLCQECHDRHKKMQEHGGIVMGCDVDGIPLDAEHWWRKRRPRGGYSGV